MFKKMVKVVMGRRNNHIKRVCDYPTEGQPLHFEPGPERKG